MATARAKKKTNAGKIGLFWSGQIGRSAATLYYQMLTAVFGAERVFVSTEIEPGKDWYDHLRKELASGSVGLFLLTPDALESRWLPFECGYFLANRDVESVIPIRVVVSQALADLRMPVLKGNQAAESGTPASFAKLCQECAQKLGTRLSPAQNPERVWALHQTKAHALLAAARAFLPDNYDGVARFTMRVTASAFQMPQVFSLLEEELFLVGLNHAYLLNIQHEPANMRALVKRLLESQNLRVRVMISDLWNSSVFDCYRNLVPPGFAEGVLRAFTAIYQSPGKPSSLDHFLEKSFGADAYRRIIDESLLEIRKLPIIFDTLWFVDRKHCQFSMANALSGPHRPFIHCGTGSDEAPDVFNYYYQLATTGFQQAQPVWPSPGT